MKKYYIERHGLLSKKLVLSFKEVLEYIEEIYHYFDKKGCFDIATKGVSKPIDNYSSEEEQVISPTFIPNAEVFFATRLQDTKVWPIYTYIEKYDEATLFSVIEILYDHIAEYDYYTGEINKDIKQNFSEQINNVIRAYKEGYYLEPTNGYIMHLPNEALQEQLDYDGQEMPQLVYEQLSMASEMYYRFDSNMEQKKKAINTLADILEKEREDVKNVLNEEYEVGKNEHDRLIFDVVNNYNIRHNNAKQKGNYSREIWYDWMMQYYTSVIITYYKLKKEYEKQNDTMIN